MYRSPEVNAVFAYRSCFSNTVVKSNIHEVNKLKEKEVLDVYGGSKVFDEV